MRTARSKTLAWLLVAVIVAVVALAVVVLVLAGATATAFMVAVVGASVLGAGVLVLGAGLLVAYPRVRGKREPGASQVRSYQDTYGS